MAKKTNIVTPMAVAGVHHLVERAYRESGELQYVRELLVNALEAGATRVEFGPDWNAVEHQHVYRLMVADNGRGMTQAQLLSFLNTFGGGGKPIGGAHENYGVGAKTSLLPWNHAGVVVCSWTDDEPDGGMVWLMHDPKTGEYGARKFQTNAGYTETVEPFGEWARARPPWLRTGTVVIALGNTGQEDTYLGKAGSGDTKAISQYLNKRVWEIPDGVEVYVQEMRYSAKKNWPRSYDEAALGPAPPPGSSETDRRWNRRRVRGARYFVAEVEAKVSEGHLASTGAVTLSDGAIVDWYLWHGQRPGVHAHAYEMGFIAALYRNELYDTQQHPAQYRTFGITQRAVRENLTLVVRPPPLTDGAGVYPDTARTTLRRAGAGVSGEPLPWAHWGHEFAENMPSEILEALAKAGPDESHGSVDQRWRDRLIDRFGQRWETLRLLIDREGQQRARPTEGRTTQLPDEREAAVSDGARKSAEPQETEPAGTLGPQGEEALFGILNRRNTANAKSVRRRGGIPEWLWTDGSEVDEGCAASWVPDTPAYPSGVVLMNRTFPAFVEVKGWWRDQYPDHLGEDVERVVEAVYGEALVARIAHSESLVHDRSWGAQRVDQALRSSEALTMAALGLVSEDIVIAARLSGVLGARKRKEVVAEQKIF